MPSIKTVAAVDRAIAIMNAFTSEDASLTLAELARRTGLYKSTILRLLGSLEAAAYVVRLDNGAYRLGPAVFHLGSVYRRSFNLEEHVVPVLRRLSEISGETCSLFTGDRNHRLCLFRVESKHTVRDVLRVGELLPMNSGANGRVLRTFSEGALKAKVEDLRNLPIIARGENRGHRSVITSPVFGLGGSLIGALGISGPTSRFTDEVIRAMCPILLAAAQDLSRNLGGDPRWFEAALARVSHPRTDRAKTPSVRSRRTVSV